MEKMLVFFNGKEYEFDIHEFDSEELNEEYPYDVNDDEFDDNDFAQFLIEHDNIVIDIIEDSEPFNKLDLSLFNFDFYVPRDNYSVIVELV
jgi:hypothetical protein